MREQQRQFDWPFARRQAALDYASLADRHRGSRGKFASAAHQGAVLRAIDRHARQHGLCWASAAELGVVAKLTARTVERVLAVLREIELIWEGEHKAKGPDGRVRKCRGIVWSRLEQLVPDDRRSRFGQGDHPATDHDHPATAQDHPATDHDHPATGGGQKGMKHLTTRTTSPSCPPMAASPAGADGSGWVAAEEELFAAGVAKAREAAQSARERGYTPDQVLALIEHYRQPGQAGKWGPGALYRRIVDSHPSWPSDAGWPEPAAAYAAAAEARRRSAASAARRAAAAAAEREAAAEAAAERERAARAAEVGAAFAGLPAAEQEAWLAATRGRQPGLAAAAAQGLPGAAAALAEVAAELWAASRDAAPSPA